MVPSFIEDNNVLPKSVDVISELRSQVSEFGFGCLTKLRDDALLRSLRHEALAQRTNARRVSDDGDVSYRGYLADLGTNAKRFLTSHSIAVFLTSVFDESFVLDRRSSCYTYFEAGDYLTEHRDGAEDCEVTVLMYLDAFSPCPDAPETGLRLHMYANRGDEPGELLHTIATHTGTLAVGRGSKVWHGRPPLQDDERIALLTACFSKIDGLAYNTTAASP